MRPRVRTIGPSSTNRSTMRTAWSSRPPPLSRRSSTTPCSPALPAASRIFAIASESSCALVSEKSRRRTWAMPSPRYAGITAGLSMNSRTTVIGRTTGLPFGCGVSRVKLTFEPGGPRIVDSALRMSKKCPIGLPSIAEIRSPTLTPARAAGPPEMTSRTSSTTRAGACVSCLSTMTVPMPPKLPSMSSRSNLASCGGRNSLCGSSSETSPVIAA